MDHRCPRRLPAETKGRGRRPGRAVRRAHRCVHILYIPFARKDPSAYFTTALAGITSALGVPAVPPSPEVAARTELRSPPAGAEQPAPASLPVLPPATNAARTEDEPEFWQLVHDRLSVSGRRPGVVPPPAKGRHARVETSGTETSVRSPEEQFARAA